MNARDSHPPAPRDAGVDRVDGIDWACVADDLDEQGASVIEGLLPADECARIAALYDADASAAGASAGARGDAVSSAASGIAASAGAPTFRSRIVMERHGFGRGEYKYFAYPLPDPVARLRESLYPRLVPIANRWHELMGLAPRFPARHADFIARCHAAGQARPTPLLLRYGAGDYNCLHQDLYGEQVFPLQVVLLLSEPGRDFTGGEFVMTEQRPRMQSRAMVLPLRQGDAAVIAVQQRPVQGSRGSYRVQMRHGVSKLSAGRRHTLGIVFHDAA